MELLYLWIEKYRNIEKQGFNFSSQYQFKLLDSKPKKTLFFSKNPNYIQKYFPSNIVNVTALIGKNGVGKSNLLDWIKENLCHSDTIETGPAIVILKTENEVFELFYHNSLDLEISTKLSVEIKKYEYVNNIVETRADSQVEKGRPQRVPYSLIFFSNVFDLRNEKEGKSLFNISTNFLVRDDSIKFKESRVKSRPNQHEDNDFEISDIHVFYTSEFIRQFNFFANYQELFTQEDNESLIPFVIPDKIILSTKYQDYREILTKTEIETLEYKMKNVWKIFKEIDERISLDLEKESDLIKVLKIKLYSACFFYFIKIRVLLTYKRKKSDFKKLTLSGKNSIELVKSFFNQIKKNNPWPQPTESTIEHKFSWPLVSTIESTFGRFEKLQEEEFLQEKNGNVFLLFTSETQKLIYYFLDGCREIFVRFRFFEFKWNNLSSGQFALLNIFSRLRSLYDRHREKSPVSNKIIIIDEGNLYLHPKWQKNFLYDFVNIFFGTYTWSHSRIHLILTSHSPFLVSDLPKDHIIFLDKDEKGLCKVVKGVDKKQTFGANIHSLFSDAFFMENGLTGSFAEQKIKNLIEFLDTGKTSDTIKNKEDAQKYIDIIGEPILKRQFQKMLNNKRIVATNKSITTTQEDVEELKKRIKALEDQLKNNNNA